MPNRSVLSSPVRREPLRSAVVAGPAVPVCRLSTIESGAKKTRIVSFRLSEEEYLGLERICREGQKTISEYAREAALNTLNGAKPRPANGSHPLNDLKRRIAQLEERLARV